MKVYKNFTCVPEWHKEHQAEDCVDDEEVYHLLFGLLVSPPVFLHREVPMVPVPVGCGDVGVGDDVDGLLKLAPLLLPELC